MNKYVTEIPKDVPDKFYDNRLVLMEPIIAIKEGGVVKILSRYQTRATQEPLLNDPYAYAVHTPWQIQGMLEKHPQNQPFVKVI